MIDSVVFYRSFRRAAAIAAAVLLAVAFGVGPGVPPASAAKPLVLAVHPYLPAPEVRARFLPLANLLRSATGRPVEIHVAASYGEHIDLVGRGQADIAYLGPVSYVDLVGKYGPFPVLVRQADKGAPTFQGAIIVREDSPIRKLSDLKGKRFAFGDPESTMSHVLPRVMMHEAGVSVQDLATHKFVGGHKTVALSVLTGDFDAGGVKEEVLRDFEGRGLRALARSEPVSEHLFVAAKKMDAGLRDRIRQTLLSANKTDSGLAAVTAIKPTLTAFVAVTDTDYDALRRTMLVYKTIMAGGDNHKNGAK